MPSKEKEHGADPNFEKTMLSLEGVKITEQKLEQKFSLRWKNYEANLVSSLQHYLGEDFLTDVTVACDGKTFKAHQVVLAACSPYFEEIFDACTHPHPIIFMVDVKSAQMKAILQFIYSGSVTLGQSALTEFLRVAEVLKIRGLSLEEQEYDHSGVPKERIRHKNESGTIHTSPETEIQVTEDDPAYDTNNNATADDLAFENHKIDENNTTLSPSSMNDQKVDKNLPVRSLLGNLIGSGVETSTVDEIMTKNVQTRTPPPSINELDADSDTGDECYSVGYYLDARSLLEKNEDDLEPDSFGEMHHDASMGGSIFEKVDGSPHLKKCKLCGKLVRGRKHRFVHMPGSFVCPFCPCVYTRSDNLNAHMRSKHGKPATKVPAPAAPPALP